MKGSRKMEIVIAIISALISAALTFIILTIINCNSKAEELTKLRVEYEEEIREERLKNSRYCISNFLYTDRNRALNNQLAEKDKLIAELTRQADRANELISALEAELSDLEPMTEKEQKSRLPKGHTNMFMGMPYDLITDTISDQYALQQECITGERSGIRMYDAGETGYFCAALGGAYGTDIGDTWHVTLKNGSEFDIILADYKHPIDNPDPNDFGDSCVNYISDDFCTNVIEFIYDKDRIPTKVMNAGTFSVLNFFGGIEGDGGDITEMKYTGRVWSR